MCCWGLRGFVFGFVQDDENVQIFLFFRLSDVSPDIVLIESTIGENNNEWAIDSEGVACVLQVKQLIGITNEVSHSVVGTIGGLVLKVELADHEACLL